jgi:hypothetical protein
MSPIDDIAVEKSHYVKVRDCAPSGMRALSIGERPNLA